MKLAAVGYRFTLLTTLILGLVGCQEDYAAVMTTKVRAALGKDFKDYIWSSYPTDNFGLATAYDPERGKSFSDENFLCATWSCLKQTVPAQSDQKLSVNGYAEVGDNGGIITLTEKVQTDLGANLVLPEIYQILKISADVGSTRNVETRLSLGRVYPRKLVRSKMTDYIGTLPSNDPLKRAFTDGRLVLIVADIVVDSMTIDIKIDTTKEAKLDAELASKLAGMVGKIIDSAKIGLHIKKATNGEYQLEVTKPVVLAVLPRQQPAAGVLALAQDNEWLDWRVTTAPHNLMIAPR